MKIQSLTDELEERQADGNLTSAPATRSLRQSTSLS